MTDNLTDTEYNKTETKSESKTQYNKLMRERVSKVGNKVHNIDRELESDERGN